MATNILPPDLARCVRPVAWLNLAADPEPLPAIETHTPSAAAMPSPPPPEPVPVIDIEAIRVEAHARGVTEGRRQAEAHAAASVQPLIEKLSGTIASLINLRPNIRRDTESDLVRLAIAISRKILRRELTVDPTAIQGLLKAALEKLQTRDINRIRVYPDQEQAIRSWIEITAPSRRVEVLGDGKLQPWDVVFETTSGRLDASIETQLSEIERGFADRLSK